MGSQAQNVSDTALELDMDSLSVGATDGPSRQPNEDHANPTSRLAELLRQFASDKATLVLEAMKTSQAAFHSFSDPSLRFTEEADNAVFTPLLTAFELFRELDTVDDVISSFCRDGEVNRPDLIPAALKRYPELAEFAERQPKHAQYEYASLAGRAFTPLYAAYRAAALFGTDPAVAAFHAVTTMRENEEPFRSAFLGAPAPNDLDPGIRERRLEILRGMHNVLMGNVAFTHVVVTLTQHQTIRRKVFADHEFLDMAIGQTYDLLKTDELLKWTEDGHVDRVLGKDLTTLLVFLNHAMNDNGRRHLNAPVRVKRGLPRLFAKKQVDTPSLSQLVTRFQEQVDGFFPENLKKRPKKARQTFLETVAAMSIAKRRGMTQMRSMIFAF
jgi:hypothetical protein